MLYADVVGGMYTPEETATLAGHAYEATGSELLDPVTGPLPAEHALDPGGWTDS